jgi:hypothetical protein
MKKPLFLLILVLLAAGHVFSQAYKGKGRVKAWSRTQTVRPFLRSPSSFTMSTPLQVLKS